MHVCTKTLATPSHRGSTVCILTCVISLVQAGCASTNRHGDYAGPALHVAAKNGDWRTVARLIADGADVNSRDGVVSGICPCVMYTSEWCERQQKPALGDVTLALHSTGNAHFM